MKINDLPNLDSSLKQKDLIVFVDNNENATKRSNIGSIVKSSFPVFCKIRTEADQVSRGYYTNYIELDGYITPDDILRFDPMIDDLEIPNVEGIFGVPETSDHAGFFQVNLNAFFTGAPPVAYINEPAQSDRPITYGYFYFLKEKHYKCNFIERSLNQPIFSGVEGSIGYLRVSEEVKSVNQINTNFSDYIEPEFFYVNDTNAYGYFVNITYITYFGTGGDPNVNGTVYFRWCSSVEGAETTLKSGNITIKKLFSFV